MHREPFSSVLCCLVKFMNVCLYLYSISEADDDEEEDGDGFPFNLNDATEPVEV